MKKFLLFCFLIQVTVSLYAIRIVHGPYICDMDSISATIMWITDKPGLSWVEVGEDGEDHFYGKARRKVYDTNRGRRQLVETLHKVRIEGLLPDTRYRYRVLTREVTTWKNNDWITYGEIASNNVYRRKPYTFKTYPTHRRDLSFLVLNDIHERADYMRELCKDIDFKQLDFVVLNGDMSNSIESEEQICRSYIDTCTSMFARYVPVFFNRGNHETRGVFADRLINYFPTPTGEYYQLKKIAGIDFLFLDSGEDKPDSDIEYSEISDFDHYRSTETKWIKSLIENGEVGKNPLIVFCHTPPMIGTWHGNYDLQEKFLPVLNTMNVSVMISGHLHRYAFQEANDRVNFPNLVNSNMTYLMCRISGGVLTVDYVGLHGKDKKSFTFPLK